MPIFQIAVLFIAVSIPLAVLDEATVVEAPGYGIAEPVERPRDKGSRRAASVRAFDLYHVARKQSWV